MGLAEGVDASSLGKGGSTKTVPLLPKTFLPFGNKAGPLPGSVLPASIAFSPTIVSRISLMFFSIRSSVVSIICG